MGQRPQAGINPAPPVETAQERLERIAALEKPITLVQSPAAGKTVHQGEEITSSVSAFSLAPPMSSELRELLHIADDLHRKLTTTESTLTGEMSGLNEQPDLEKATLSELVQAARRAFEHARERLEKINASI
jgi:hypothetical protein